MPQLPSRAIRIEQCLARGYNDERILREVPGAKPRDIYAAERRLDQANRSNEGRIVRCPSGHDLTLPDAVAESNKECRECHRKRDRERQMRMEMMKPKPVDYHKLLREAENVVQMHGRVRPTARSRATGIVAAQRSTANARRVHARHLQAVAEVEYVNT